jgi:hypothetical protein
MEIRLLRSPDEHKRYVDFAHEVYRENPHWVPPYADHVLELLAGQPKAGSHWDTQPFWAERDGRVLATVTAVVDALYDQRWNERTGHLLLFEALPDTGDAVAALLARACDWLAERGCGAARFGFLFGWQLPLTIDAYESVPTVFHTYNPPSYHAHAKNAGFATERGAVQYEIAFTEELAARYREMVHRAATAGVVLRTWRFDRLDEETRLFDRLFDETFARHWGAPPLTGAQMADMTVGMRDVLVPDLLWFAEVHGEPVGFVYAVPDVNQALHEARLAALRGAPAEPAFDTIDRGVLQIIGVQEEYRGRGINLALAAQSYLAMIARGYKSASYTMVLDDNWPSRRTAERLGGRVTRNFVIYRRALARRDK